MERAQFIPLTFFPQFRTEPFRIWILKGIENPNFMCCAHRKKHTKYSIEEN